MDPSEYECAICQNLLLDPVVGPCGHDYCRSCLERWRATKSSSSSTVACPLCREPVPGELGVCVRLRETIQRFFPEEVKKRRLEVGERTGNLAKAARQQATQRGATASIVAPSVGAVQMQRWPPRLGVYVAPASLPPTASATPQPQARVIPLSWATAHTPQPLWQTPVSLSLTLGASSASATPPPLSQARMAPVSPVTPWMATASAAVVVAPAQPTPLGAIASPPDTWMPPSTLSFSLGWHDPAETRGRRSLGRRRRLVSA
ncbi:hypothetical protein Vafri_17013 [Volvox africanus]|uniref:RING-type domain-containing protein n=1 Tax=Volvox africanus TaxID=51714 RepID=A0A8J4BJJ5_9CHLO|nr:hypothetical protein Vafri_17013 [Volvox africanus]